MPITELRIQGLRTIEDIRLKLDGLTVLIGNNGSGKSSIIEACEILRRAGSDRFLDNFHNIHGGLAALLRRGAKRLKLSLVIKSTPDELPRPEHGEWLGFDFVEYNLSLVPSGAFAVVEELIRVQERKRPSRVERGVDTKNKRSAGATRWKTVVQGRGGSYEADTGDDSGKLGYRIVDGGTFVSYLKKKEMAPGDIAAQIIGAHLRSLRVHLPFEVIPAWAARALDRKSALRASVPFAPADRLEMLGANLANVFHALKNNYGQEEWKRTLSYVQLGLGNHIEDVTTWADPGGGNVGLSLKLSGLDQQIPSSQISDGMLAYLAFVALFRLDGSKSSLIALDEPDLHFHPQLLMRVVDMLEELARSFPVLVATHSDRLLDGLSDPSRSVVLCELDHNQATRLVRPDPKALAKWLKRYRGLGDIRSAGHEASVLTRKELA